MTNALSASERVGLGGTAIATKGSMCVLRSRKTVRAVMYRGDRSARNFLAWMMVERQAWMDSTQLSFERVRK
jgi:hypothetical protein